MKKLLLAPRFCINKSKNTLKAKNLTSNAGIFLLFKNAKSNRVFELSENHTAFDNEFRKKAL